MPCADESGCRGGPRLIVALDFANGAAALDMAARLDPAACRLKVGKELFTSAGPELVRQLVARGFGVFLDLKFHDIPNTVAGAVRAAAALGVWMLDVHASGGRRMLAAAHEALAGVPNRPKRNQVMPRTPIQPKLASINVDAKPSCTDSLVACAIHGVIASMSSR